LYSHPKKAYVYVTKFVGIDPQSCSSTTPANDIFDDDKTLDRRRKEMLEFKAATVGVDDVVEATPEKGNVHISFSLIFS
jgi:hypothetical protein